MRLDCIFFFNLHFTQYSNFVIKTMFLLKGALKCVFNTADTFKF